MNGIQLPETETHSNTKSIVADQNEILRRVAIVCGAKNDSAIARVLGISPQSVSNWRKRGNIPYGLITQLAHEKGISLDYLLLGRGSKEPQEQGFDASLIADIAELINNSIENLTTDSLIQSSRECAYLAALIYEKAVLSPSTKSQGNDGTCCLGAASAPKANMEVKR